jgi:hypothetical protein
MIGENSTCLGTGSKASLGTILKFKVIQGFVLIPWGISFACLFVFVFVVCLFFAYQ